MIFQDPMTTLNPVLRIDTQMIEAVRAHEKISEKAARERARDALAKVGIPSPEERLKAYPNQFSGGNAPACGHSQRPCSTARRFSWPTSRRLRSTSPFQAQILSEVQDLCAETGTAAGLDHA